MDADETLRALHQMLGERGIIAGPEVGQRYLVDVPGEHGERPLAVLQPLDTVQVSQVPRVPRICHAAGLPVVTQGGRSGLARGQLPRSGVE
ncbi:hypothetical protein WKW80_29350 [Variovorax humicola]|uniref:FAD-binding oxidoreductase n=1 Tax=Variovorax humicola TaxID=1769758 RepID=A0ABU8W9M3_9BURK